MMSQSLHRWCHLRKLPKYISWNRTSPLTFSYINHHVHQVGPRSISSSLFISDRETDLSTQFVFDHGFQERLKKKDELKKNVQLRGLEINIDKLVEEYQQFRALVSQREDLEKHRENVARKMAELVKGKDKKAKGKDSNELKKALIDRGKKLKQEHKQLMPQFWEMEEQLMLKLLALPSDLLEDVPEQEKILDEGFQENKKVLDMNHLEVLAGCKDVRLSAVGDRAYYLHGRLATLEQELLDRFSTELRQCGITTLLAPEMFKTPIVEGGGIDVTSPDSTYRLCHKPVQRELTDWDPDHLFLRGASHLSFLAFLARINISRDRLPLKLFTVGRGYTPVDSTKDLPGLYGVTQSSKVMLCGVGESRAQCTDIMGEFQSRLTDVYRRFELPYRLVSMPAQCLNVMEQNRIELQFWSPSLQKYIKVASLSACGDYSSRRLNISCSDYDRPGDSPTPVHLVHGDFADITRLIALLLEYDRIY